VNPALVAFAGTVTVAGTATAALLLVSLTLNPLLGAAAFSVTVQDSSTHPVVDALPQDTALNAAVLTVAAVFIPAPLRLIAATVPLVPLLSEVMVSCPVSNPEAVGANFTFKL
jgi:hypothetical protein